MQNMHNHAYSFLHFFLHLESSSGAVSVSFGTTFFFLLVKGMSWQNVSSTPADCEHIDDVLNKITNRFCGGLICVT